VSQKQLRSKVLSLLNAEQLLAVDALIEGYEKEQIELCIDSSEPEAARRRVQAAREIRGLLRLPVERRE